MSGGCGETDQVQSGSPPDHDDVGVSAHGMVVDVLPNPLDQGPVVLGGFASTNEYRRNHEMQTILATSEILVDAIG